MVTQQHVYLEAEDGSTGKTRILIFSSVFVARVGDELVAPGGAVYTVTGVRYEVVTQEIKLTVR